MTTPSRTYEELQHICRTLLDNADLDISWDTQNSDLILHFFMSKEVIFRCTAIHIFRMVKAPEDAEAFFVGETYVTRATSPHEIRTLLEQEGTGWTFEPLPEQMYRIVIRGGIDLDVICSQLSWKLQDAVTQAETQNH